jgi:hypothetical protein
MQRDSSQSGFALLVLLLLSACGGGSDGGSVASTAAVAESTITASQASAASRTLLPIEVLGVEGTTKDVPVVVDKKALASATTLLLRVHGLRLKSLCKLPRNPPFAARARPAL